MAPPLPQAFRTTKAPPRYCFMASRSLVGRSPSVTGRHSPLPPPPPSSAFSTRHIASRGAPVTQCTSTLNPLVTSWVQLFREIKDCVWCVGLSQERVRGWGGAERENGGVFGSGVLG